jgi:hypothetical protein
LHIISKIKLKRYYSTIFWYRVNGLAAMRPMDIRQDLTIWRPFLDLSRQQIENGHSKLDLNMLLIQPMQILIMIGHGVGKCCGAF